MALCVLGRESSNDFPNEFRFYYLNNNKIKKCEFFFREFQPISRHQLIFGVGRN